MLSHGIVEVRVEETLDLYFGQCSILVTADDLAMIAATLANDGVHPRPEAEWWRACSPATCSRLP